MINDEVKVVGSFQNKTNQSQNSESNSHERLRPDQGYKKEFSVLRDYSLDNKSQGRQSLSSQKVGPESDTDSMAEYGEGDTGNDNNTWNTRIPYFFPILSLL